MSTHSSDSESTSTHSRRRWVREVALTVGAVAGLLCVLMALSAFLFGITPLVFRSGSMAPAIETGALALSKTTPAVDVQVGDVVNVTNASGNGITHRVFEIGPSASGSVELNLKGDANADPDAEPYVVSEVRRVLFSVPKLGYAVTWLSGPVAVFVGGVLVGILLMIAWKPQGRTDPEPSSDDSTSGKHGKMPLSIFAALAMIGAVGIASSNPPVALAAPLTNTSTATSGTISTILPAPVNYTCANRALSTARLSWTNNPAYSYEITVGTSPNPIVLAPAAGATRTYNTGDAGALLSLGSMPFTLRARSGTFLSAPAGTWNVSFTTFLFSTCTSFTAATSGASARRAPDVPTTATEASPTATQTTTASAVPTPSTTDAPTSTTTTTTATTTTPSADVPEPSPAAVEPPPAPATTTTPPAPANLISPQSSPSGSSVAKVVEVEGSPTLQITDSAGAVQYSAPAVSDSQYGYGVAWASGDQLWLLGTDQLVRLDRTGSGWSRSVVDPSATDEIPDEIAARMN
nr:signal peptidase I [Rhodococcus sp. (in: high G+C Gram-positive bacteria)]